MISYNFGIFNLYFQREYALSLLKEGRIDGIIFEANSGMGVGIEGEKRLGKSAVYK